MPASPSALLYVGIKRSVLALDAHSGEIVWEAQVAGLGNSFVTVHVAGGLVYAAHAGEVTALDAHTGAEVWHNELEGQGRGFVTFATAERGGDPAAGAAVAAQAARNAADAA